MERRKTRLGSSTKAPFGRSIAGFMAKGPFFRGRGCLAARRFPVARLSPSSQLMWQSPVVGPDGNPQPPSPCLRGTAADAASDRLGLPRPGQAFALSHFRTPHEAPLTGQDGRTIRRAGSAGIGIHSQVRERLVADFFVARMERSAIRGRPKSGNADRLDYQGWLRSKGPDFAEFITGAHSRDPLAPSGLHSLQIDGFGMNRFRHCDRSEAIQIASTNWIASSLRSSQ
jgi:hypothetical protein